MLRKREAMVGSPADARSVTLERGQNNNDNERSLRGKLTAAVGAFGITAAVFAPNANADNYIVIGGACDGSGQGAAAIEQQIGNVPPGWTVKTVPYEAGFNIINPPECHSVPPSVGLKEGAQRAVDLFFEDPNSPTIMTGFSMGEGVLSPAVEEIKRRNGGVMPPNLVAIANAGGGTPETGVAHHSLRPVVGPLLGIDPEDFRPTVGVTYKTSIHDVFGTLGADVNQWNLVNLAESGLAMLNGTPNPHRIFNRNEPFVRVQMPNGHVIDLYDTDGNDHLTRSLVAMGATITHMSGENLVPSQTGNFTATAMRDPRTSHSENFTARAREVNNHVEVAVAQPQPVTVSAPKQTVAPQRKPAVVTRTERTVELNNGTKKDGTAKKSVVRGSVSINASTNNTTSKVRFGNGRN